MNKLKPAFLGVDWGQVLACIVAMSIVGYTLALIAANVDAQVDCQRCGWVNWHTALNLECYCSRLEGGTEVIKPLAAVLEQCQ